MHRSPDAELGALLATQVGAHSQVTAQTLQALIQDLIGADLSLRAPLRELCQSPAFLRASPLRGGAENLALRDALVLETGQVFQPELVARVSRFLSGYLGVEEQPLGPTEAARPEPPPPSGAGMPPPGPAPINSVTQPSPAAASGRLSEEAMKHVSPRMQERLHRIDRLIDQGYSLHKAMGAFPYLISPAGAKINPSWIGKGRVAGFSWIGFFFPFVTCFQMREWSYFWVTGIAYFMASLIHVGTGVSLQNPINIAIALTYGLSMPYLRYQACKKPGVHQFSLSKSIILGLLLSIAVSIPSILIDMLRPS